MKTLTLLFLLFNSITFGFGNTKTILNQMKIAEISVQNSTKVDEFYSYWVNEFRITPTCDVTYSQYLEMLGKYNVLNDEEKAEVNIKDAAGSDGEGYKVIDVITTLINKFNSSGGGASSNKDDLDQSTMIGIISGVAIFGVSAILVLYILKNKKIIK